MCKTSLTTGTCERCPAGWTASGAFCVECDAMWSCDADGNATCRGACKVGNLPTCDAFSKSVVCSRCSLNLAELAIERKIVTRGGILGVPTSCAAYFQCEKGYYLNQGSGQSLLCASCAFPERSSDGKIFVSHGLTFGDEYSCMYASTPLNVSRNAIGQYGDPIQSCPPMTTSIAFAALSASDCVACPNPPAFGLFSLDVAECVPVCRAGYEKRGDACVAPKSECDRDGYAMVGGVCDPQPLPWNRPGTDFQGLLEVLVSSRSVAWAALEESGVYRVLASTNRLARSNNADVCSGLVSVVPVVNYVQDVPLYTSKCGDVEQHAYYMLTGTAKYVYAFLERSFGNNNRFVMWQVLRQPVGGIGVEGQVMQTWRLPGKVCSAAVAPGDVVYMYFCGSHVVSFVNATDYLGASGIVYDVLNGGQQYLLKRQAHVLIGRDEPGNRDGMRDQALFRGALSMAVTSDTRRLFVADRQNCRVVEVVVHYPGSFLTRATTIGASGCFSGPFPLPYPRLMTARPGGSAFVFLSDAGLMGLDFLNRKFVTVMTRDELLAAGVREPQWITVSETGEKLELHTATHTALFTRLSEPCSVGYVSARGGNCMICPLNTYYQSNQCRPCSTALSCGVNSRLVPCSLTEDAKCEPCTGAAAYSFRYGSECEIIPQYPCPPGYYGLSDCFACVSKSLAQLPVHGVCQCLGLPLVGASKTCDVASPFPGAVGPFQAPAWVVPLACTYMSENCTDRGCYLAKAVPRACEPCPAGTVGGNGLWCESCPGFREPNAAQDACLCRSPSVLSRDGLSCVCPVGYTAGGSAGCTPCPPGTVRTIPTTLPDLYWIFSGGSCEFCPAGTEARQDRAGCAPCSAGRYREGAMQSCGLCEGKAFAKNPASSASCTACSAVCGPGKRWEVCPVDATWFSCVDCPALSGSKRWVDRGGNRNCLWECVDGFYEFNENCWRCTTKTCPNGFKETPCTKYEDSHCRVPCEDNTKPREHSIWLNDCYWDCEPGYIKILKDYPGWLEYACVKPPEFPWSLTW